MNDKIYYVAGPMELIPEHNRKAFDQKTKELRRMGYIVYNPVDADIQAGYDLNVKRTPEERREMFKKGMDFLCLRATHIYMLDGWADSRGSKAEYWTAVSLGLEIEGSRK